jgi:hypothetical protein
MQTQRDAITIHACDAMHGDGFCGDTHAFNGEALGAACQHGDWRRIAYGALVACRLPSVLEEVAHFMA